MRTIAQTENVALTHYLPYIPLGKREAVAPIVHDWAELRVAAVARRRSGGDSLLVILVVGVLGPG